jgi:branched-chain amino acid transport system substrate-binding protein
VHVRRIAPLKSASCRAFHPAGREYRDQETQYRVGGHRGLRRAQNIKIGFSLAKTGLFAAGAPSQLNAYELWREQVNAKGGLDVAGGKRMVAFVQYDDQSNPGNAVRIYEKLITDDKVELLLAPWGTPHHFALAPVLEKYKFPMVGNTAASVQLRTLKANYIWFPTSTIPDKMAVEMAAMLKANGYKTAALISNVLPFAKEVKAFLVPALKQSGIELKVSEEYPPDIKDMTAILTKVKTAATQAVIVLSYPSDSVLYAKQAKEMGIVAPFQFVAIGPTIDFYSKVVGPAADGFVTMGHWSPAKAEWKRAKPFYDAYVKKFNAKPDYLDSVLAYMSAEILEQAVAKAGTDKEIALALPLRVLGFRDAHKHALECGAAWTVQRHGPGRSNRCPCVLAVQAHGVTCSVRSARS